MRIPFKVTINNPDFIYIVDSVKSITSGYMIYIFDKENAYMIPDKTFILLKERVHKGEDPWR